MKALRLESKRPRDIALVDLPRPEPAPHEVRLAVDAVGICGSDLSAALGKANFDFVERPRVLGHEFSARVDRVGDAVEGWETGDAVCALAVHSCHRCANCRAGNTQRCRGRRILGFHMPGAMAEFVNVDARYLMPLRYGLSPLEGALVEPLAVASRCVLKSCQVVPGHDVVVSGCGIIGLLCALLARAGGANVTVSGAEADAGVRLAAAARLGFQTVVVGPDKPLAAQLPAPVDLLIEASGAPSALAAAGESVAWGGLIAVIATYGSTVEWPATEVVRAEQRIHTCMSAAWDDFEMAQRHLRDGVVPVADLVETFPLDDAVAAFEASWAKGTIKAVLLPG